MMDLFQSALLTISGIAVTTYSYFVTQAIANFNAIILAVSKGGIEAFGAVPPLIALLIQFGILYIELRVIYMILVLFNEVPLLWHQQKSYSVLRPGGKRILIIGDSTAYGAGALKPEDSIAGRLGHDFPHTEIINTAVNGSLTRDAVAQLHKTEGKFDLILIFTGGNDIWHFTGLASLERNLSTLLHDAMEKSDNRVFLLFYADFGRARIFPALVRVFLNKRTTEVHSLFQQVTSAFNVALIELYSSTEIVGIAANPFNEEPTRYVAKDGMHPNSEGYRLWYNRMWREMMKRHLVFEE